MSQPAVFQPKHYRRKPFVVKAERVTAENIHEVARWCRGSVRTGVVTDDNGAKDTQKYIKVNVKRALNDRQRRAYIGDWVLKAGMGFKVYTPSAFSASFEPKEVERMLETVDRMLEREEAEDELERDQLDSTTTDTLPVSGRNTSFLSAD